jgi:CBS domain-containing membrane protein
MRREAQEVMPTIPVSEIMTTKLRTMRADDSVTIAEWLLALDEIHHVVVVDEANKVIGIVSDRDILRAFGSKPVTNMPVSGIMSKHVQTIGPEAPAREALARMQRGKFHALPVTDNQDRLVGIVTSTDFLDVAGWALGVERRLEPRPVN